jgi:hypothetical protein
LIFNLFLALLGIFSFPLSTSDNDDAYNLTPAFILETVAAARGFVCDSQNVPNATDADRRGIAPKVAKFLDWPTMRVENALAQLSAIEGGELSKQAVESLPTIQGPTSLRVRP